MEINFRSECGLCPYFIYKDTKFFIRDTREGKDYVYSTYLKNLKTTTEHFNSHKEACTYVNSKNNIRKICEHDGKILFTNYINEYIVNGDVVDIHCAARSVSGNFDKYIDCLNFSKEYVANFIKVAEPQQLELSI